MASSSVSQESLDQEDTVIDFNARRSRIRGLRARGALQRAGDRDVEPASVDSTDSVGCDFYHNTNNSNGDGHSVGYHGHQSVHYPGHAGDVGEAPGAHEHESSPTRLASRLKDKRSRPNHPHKGKLAKDKRKLREKRRSTGVIHLASTESTGDSVDEDNDEAGTAKQSGETNRNTKSNEVIDADNPQTPSEEHASSAFKARRDKSPSDLEADLEDNQDYDSTVSQSEANLTLFSDKVPALPKRLPTFSNITHTNSHHHPPPLLYNSTKNNYKMPESGSSSSFSSMSSWRNQDRRFTHTPHHPSSAVISSKYSTDSEPVKSPSYTSVYPCYQPEKQTENHAYQSYSSSRFRVKDTTNCTASGKLPISVPHDRDTNSTSSSTQNYPPARRPDNVPITQNNIQPDKSLHEENARLLKVIDERDRRIVELESQIAALTQRVNGYEEHNTELQGENSALLRALTRLTAQ